jgi:hypothetical protein
MAREIFYNSLGLKTKNGLFLMTEHGSANCFELDGTRERTWNPLIIKGKEHNMAKDAKEISDYLKATKGTGTNKDFGNDAYLSVYGKTCWTTTFTMFYNLLMWGANHAISVDAAVKYGLGLELVIYSGVGVSYNSISIHNEDELLKELENNKDKEYHITFKNTKAVEALVKLFKAVDNKKGNTIILKKENNEYAALDNDNNFTTTADKEKATLFKSKAFSEDRYLCCELMEAIDSHHISYQEAN